MRNAIPYRESAPRVPWATCVRVLKSNLVKRSEKQWNRKTHKSQLDSSLHIWEERAGSRPGSKFTQRLTSESWPEPHSWHVGMYRTSPSAAPASDTPPPLTATKSLLSYHEEKKWHLRWAPQMQNKKTERKEKRGREKHGHRRRAKNVSEHVSENECLMKSRWESHYTVVGRPSCPTAMCLHRTAWVSPSVQHTHTHTHKHLHARTNTHCDVHIQENTQTMDLKKSAVVTRCVSRVLRAQRLTMTSTRWETRASSARTRFSLCIVGRCKWAHASVPPCQLVNTSLFEGPDLNGCEECRQIWGFEKQERISKVKEKICQYVHI